MHSEKEYVKILPLSKGLNNIHATGHIHLYSASPYKEIKRALDGLFTFCLYKRGEDTEAGLTEFANNKIVKGLELYLDMLHDTTRNDKLSKWGALIYTDTPSFKYIRKLFPLKTYPKVFFAVVLWPYFTKSNEQLADCVLRCMRHHGKELFPDKNICARDADTCFEMRPYMKNKEHEKQMIQLIRDWELSFLYAWLPSLTPQELAMRDKTKRSITKNIVLGSEYNYYSHWHVDIPFPTPFKEGIYKNFDMLTFYKNNPSIYFKGRGLFAGFINLSKGYKSKLWNHIIEYLCQRYYIIDLNGETNISDTYDTLGWGITTNDIGKDEKILIFVYTRFALNDIYIMYFMYLALEPRIIDLDVYNQGYKKELLINSIAIPGYVDAALRLTLKDIETHANVWHKEANKAIKRGDKDSDYIAISRSPRLAGLSKRNMNISASEYFIEEFRNLQKEYKEFLAGITAAVFYSKIDIFLRANGYDTAEPYFYPRSELFKEYTVYHLPIKIKHKWVETEDRRDFWKLLLKIRAYKKTRRSRKPTKSKRTRKSK